MDINEARRFFSDLKEIWVNYFVVGGLAYDGLRGTLTRPHKDVDLYVMNSDIPRLIDSIGGYDFVRGETYHTLQTRDFQADILPLRQEGDTLYRIGTRSEIRYPREAFASFQPSRIDGLQFRIARSEVLRATSRYSRLEDQEFVRGLPVDEDLLARIQVRDLVRG